VTPERLASNPLLRGLVRAAGFRRARWLIQHALVPLVVTPARQRRLGALVEGQLQTFFPHLGGDEAARRARAYVANYVAKLAEDVITVNVVSVPWMLGCFDDLVAFEGRAHFGRAVRAGRGVLAVGAHLGSITFGTAALLSLHLTLAPAERPLTRLTTEPDVDRAPHVRAALGAALGGYGADIALLLTDRPGRDIAHDMAETLGAGGLVTTNLDVLRGGGSRKELRLFGGRARLTLPALVGAAKMALHAGATVLPWVNLRQGEGFRLVVAEPIGPLPRLGAAAEEGHPEVEALCERLREILEGWIAAQPEQWIYWDRLHKRLVEARP